MISRYERLSTADSVARLKECTSNSRDQITTDVVRMNGLAVLPPARNSSQLIFSLIAYPSHAISLSRFFVEGFPALTSASPNWGDSG